jgi:hypothetical protein
MRRIKYSTKRNQIKDKNCKFGKLNIENDANKVICNRSLATLALKVFELKIVKLRRFFRRFRQIRRYWAVDSTLIMSLPISCNKSVERPAFYDCMCNF